MDKKIIDLAKFRAQLNTKNRNMLFITIVAGALAGLIVWHFFVENVAHLDVEIPPSQNISYNNSSPVGTTTNNIAATFENSEGKPILLYVYTTWCKVCSVNFPTINEIAREFQNTDLVFISVAIDRDMTAEQLQQYLSHYGEVYFQPQFLLSKIGFIEFLQKHKIKYNGRIPFTALISDDGEVITTFSGNKSKNYLRNKIIKALAL